MSRLELQWRHARWLMPSMRRGVRGLFVLLFTPAALTAQGAVTPRIAVGPNLRVAAGEHNEVWVGGNPDVLIAVGQIGAGVDGGIRGSATFMSRDGGRLWTPVSLPGYSSGAFDPMVVAGADGRVYVMHTMLGGEFAALIGGDASVKPTIRVWSTLDGWTWEGPGELRAPVPPDHPRMVADLTEGPYRGRLYIAWNDVADQFLRDQYEVFLQYSDDHGRTFSEPLLVDRLEGGKLVATEPVVLSDGTLLVTYYQYWNPLADPRNDRMPFFVSRSTDGGATFSPPEQVLELGPHVWRDRMGEFSRAFTLPIVAADTSSTSPHRDHIYIAWDDVASGRSDIWLVRSTDGGRTWSPRLRVNDNSPGSALGVADYRMTPTVAVSPTGTVGIAWYDRRNDPARRCWELFFAASVDGGATVGANVAVSSAASCPPAGQTPSAIVHNRAPHRDPNRPPDSLVERMTLLQRLGVQTPDALRAARADANRGLEDGRLRISFDASRNIWPGHYSGLSADHAGVFHAVWLDRRNGAQEIHATRITVGGAPPDRSGLREADVTERVEVLAGSPVYDAAAGTVRIAIQVRNVSDAPIFGPITVRITGIATTPAGPTATVLGDARTNIRFARRLGADDMLAPLGLSEPVEITIRTREATGLDAALDFRVLAHVPRQPASPSSRDVLTTGLPHVLLRTERGDIELEIDTAHAPVTGVNFLRYVDGRFFDGGRFFRTVRADNQPLDSVRIAVVQAGIDPARAQEQFAPIALEPTNVTGLRHREGTVSMARAAPNSATSSFFITLADEPALDSGGLRNPDGLGFAAFARVVQGMDVVRAIHAAPADERQMLLEPVRILSAHRIER
jgi:peptidyl-prolyl cis-trans isomerase A (cyclophilin A)